MTRIAYRLIPKVGGGFHLGREGLDQEASAESFPSDSLFAALMATLRNVDADRFEDFIAHWVTAPAPAGPPFRLSSLFPIAGQLPLLPIPRLRVNLGNDPRPGVAKTLKRIAYVSPVILDRLLSGAAMDRWLPDDNGPAAVFYFRMARCGSAAKNDPCCQARGNHWTRPGCTMLPSGKHSRCRASPWTG